MTTTDVAPRDRLVALPVRIIGAALLAAAGGIHLYLYFNGYRGISIIGPLFMAHAVSALVLAVAVLVVPGRRLPWVAAAAALFEAGALGGLVLSLTVGFFGFIESVQAPLLSWTVAVEVAGFLLFAGYVALILLRRGRQRAPAS